MKGFLNTKKIIAIGLALTFTVSLAGCGKKQAAENTAPTATPAPTAVTTPSVVTPTALPTIPDSQKVTPPPIVIKDKSINDKKLSPAERDRRKKLAAFTEALANDKRMAGSSVSTKKDSVTATLTVKPEISAADAKNIATEYAGKMKPLYNKAIKVIVVQNGKTIAEASL